MSKKRAVVMLLLEAGGVLLALYSAWLAWHGEWPHATYDMAAAIYISMRTGSA